jgi:Zn finger protein HypA/HybF involved in hydrogenase expression
MPRSDLDTCDVCGEEMEDYLLERYSEHEYEYLCPECRARRREVEKGDDRNE